MSYPESVRYLYALGNELKAGAKFGLERMQSLMNGLGHPECHPRVVHVAGTNGKGSTSAMIAAACQAAGLRTGLYTSPHLISPTERIQIDGKPVGEDRFAALFDRVHSCAERMLERGELDAHPSYFETVTAMAFEAFRGTTDIAIVEVGLGGRLDATNVVEPVLTVITPVDYDHEAFLGSTLTSIAGEKAGILKRGVPVVVGPQHEAAEVVIAQRAAELGCPVHRVSDQRITAIEVAPFESRFLLNGMPLHCTLAGRHQIQNAAAAVLASTQLELPQTAIQQGIRDSHWPGRLERVRTSPDFILDGAHNPAGARALAGYIREFFSDRPVWMVYGGMRDKAIDEVTGLLMPLATQVIFTAPSFERALRPQALAELTGIRNAILAPDVVSAIATAETAPENAAVFFTGSLFVVGEARALLVR